MARLPIPGQDNGTWGDILNDYLSQTHKADGALKDNVVTSAAIAPNTITNASIASGSITNTLLADGTIAEAKLTSAVQTKLNTIAPVTSVASKTGVVTLIKDDVGLNNVDNTSDATKNTATATLTNKTIDADNNTISNLAHGAEVDDPSTGVHGVSGSVVGTTDTQTLTNKTLTTPVISQINDANGNAALSLAATASAVNYVSIVNAATGNSPAIQATGSDTNVGWFLDSKGTGSHTFRDGSGNKRFQITGDASSVNSVRVTGAATGNTPSLDMTGSSDTNVGLTLTPKGSGKFTIYVPSGQTPIVSGSGADANHDLNLTSKGTGVVQANGVQIADVSSAQTLTNKTLTTPNIDTIKDSTSGADMIRITPEANPVTYFNLYNRKSGSTPIIGVGGSDTNISINLLPKGTGIVQANGIQIADVSSTQTLTNKTLRAAVFVDTNGNTAFDVVPVASAVNYVRFLNAATSGTPKVTAAGTDTNINISIEPKGSGKFQIYTTAGNVPTIQAQGADTNVDLNLRTKGTGTIQSWQESGNAGWDINGADTDVGFNFELQGAGTLQVNSVDVATKNDLMPPHYQMETDSYIATMPRAQLARVYDYDGLGSGYVQLTYVYPTVNRTINRIDIPIRDAAGATPTLSRVGIYSADGSGNLTLIGSSPNDTAMFTTAWDNKTVSLSADVDLVAGTTYAFGFLIVSGASMPGLWGNVIPGDESAVAPLTNGYIDSQSDLPSSVDYWDVWANGCMVYMRGYEV